MAEGKGLRLGFTYPRAISDLLTSSNPWEVFWTRLGLTVAVLLLTFVLSRIARDRLRAGLLRGGLQINVAILLARLLAIGVWCFGILSVLYIFDVGLTPVAALIGVVGLAASLAFQQVLQNLVAGVYLLAERPFHIGDLIAVVGPAGANHEGTVEDIQMRTTHLRNRHHELILVPNSAIFSGVVTNRSAVGGHISHVSVTFPRATEPDAVRRQIFPILDELPGVLDSPGPQLQIDKVGKDDWMASLLFWVDAEEVATRAVWAIARTCPEATVNTDAGETP